MKSKLLHFLKIFGISLACFIVFIAGYLGVVYLITGFKAKQIPIQDLYFSQTHYFFSDKDENGDDINTGKVMLVSTPLDTTDEKVVLDFKNGIGDGIVKLPIAEGEEKCIVNVNSAIELTLVRDEQTNSVIGGEVQLIATSVNNTHETCECTIYIDIPVDQFQISGSLINKEDNTLGSSVNDTTVIYPNDKIQFSVDETSISPAKSLQPFKDVVITPITGENRENENVNLPTIPTQKKKVFWESSNAMLASVDDKGVVTILPGAMGQVTITARIFKTYELEQNHKDYSDFENDPSIPSDADLNEYYNDYMDNVSAKDTFVINISDISVDHIDCLQTSTTGNNQLSIELNTSKTFYMSKTAGDVHDYEDLQITINPSEDALRNFSSEDLRYKLKDVFVAVGSYNGQSISSWTSDYFEIISPADGKTVSIRAINYQNFVDETTCLIVGLGQRDENQNFIIDSNTGAYQLAKDKNGEEIPYKIIYLKITQKELNTVKIADKDDYENINEISSITSNVNLGGKVELFSQISPKDATYSLVVYFAKEVYGDIVDIDSTLGFTMGGENYYPIGKVVASKTDANKLVNSKIETFKNTGTLMVLAAVVKTDHNGDIILVDGNGARVKKQDNTYLTFNDLQNYQGEQVYYAISTICDNNYTINITDTFNAANVTVQQSINAANYEEILLEDRLNQTAIFLEDDTLSFKFAYIDATILSSIFLANNYKFTSTNQSNVSWNQPEFKEGTGEIEISVTFMTLCSNVILSCEINGELVLNYSVSVTSEKITKLEIESNAKIDEQKDNISSISIYVDPNDFSEDPLWRVFKKDDPIQMTYLEIGAKYSFDGNNMFNIDVNSGITVNYSLSVDNINYSNKAVAAGKTLAQILTPNKIGLTSETTTPKTELGILEIFNIGTIYVKAEIEAYGDTLESNIIKVVINSVFPEDMAAWTIEESYEEESLEVSVPFIDNDVTLSASERYKTNKLEDGIYAQLANVDNSDVSTVVVNLRNFVYATKGNGNFTKFLRFEIIGYDIILPDGIEQRDVSYNKASLKDIDGIGEDLLCVKAVNYTTIVYVKVSTYFGLSKEISVKVSPTFNYQLSTNYAQYGELAPEYVAKGVSLNILDRFKFYASTYIKDNVIYNNVNSEDGSEVAQSLALYIDTCYDSIGFYDIINKADGEDSFYVDNTNITVMVNYNDYYSFKISYILDFDKTTNNTLEQVVPSYYFVQTIPTSIFTTNNKSTTTLQNIVYENFLIGQTYDLANEEYFTYEVLQFETIGGYNTVKLDAQGKPEYLDNTNLLTFEYKETNYSVRDYALYDNDLLLIQLIQGQYGRRNLLYVGENVDTQYKLIIYVGNSEGLSRPYYINLIPFTIESTIPDGELEMYVDTTFDLTDIIEINTYNVLNSKNEALKKLQFVYELGEEGLRLEQDPEGIISNRPFYDLSSDGKLSIQNDSGRKVGQVLTLRVKISVGNIVKEVNFRIGEITIEKTVQTSTYQYQGLEYHNLLNGGLINLQSSITGTSTLKEGNLDFNYYFADKSTFVYLDANSNVIPNGNLAIVEKGDYYYINHGTQNLMHLNKITGALMATNNLKNKYQLFTTVVCSHSGYDYTLNVKLNSIEFTIEEPESMKTVTIDGDRYIALISTLTDSEQGTLPGNYASAKVYKLVNPNENPQPSYNEQGDCDLTLTYSVTGEGIVSVPIDNIVYVRNESGLEIAQIDSTGKITVSQKLIHEYRFALEIRYQFQGSDATTSIGGFKIVIVPEYVLTQEDNNTYTEESPFNVELASKTTINFANEIVSIKKVYLDNHIIEYKKASVDLGNFVIDYTYEILSADDADKKLIEEFTGGQSLNAGKLYLPKNIANKVTLVITASFAISNEQEQSKDEQDKIESYYYFELIPLTSMEIITDNPTTELTKEDNSVQSYIKVTTENMTLDLTSLISINGSDTYEMSFVTNECYVKNISNIGTKEGLVVNQYSIQTIENITTITLNNYNKTLTCNYALQKEVFLKIRVNVEIETNNYATYYLYLNLLPEVKVSLREKTSTIIAGDSFIYSSVVNVSKAELVTIDSSLGIKDFVYNTLADVSDYSNFIKFIDEKEDTGHLDYNYAKETSIANDEIEYCNISVMLMYENNKYMKVDDFLLNIYPKYKFVTKNTNANGEIELFEGQTQILAGEYIDVYSVNTIIINGEPVYEFDTKNNPVYNYDALMTSRITLLINESYGTYAKVTDDFTKVYILNETTGSTIPVVVTTNISDDDTPLELSTIVNIKIIKLNFKLSDHYNNTAIGGKVVIPTGSNDLVLLRNSVTHTDSYYFTLSYVKDSKTEYLYYSNASTYYQLEISDFTSSTGEFKKIEDTAIGYVNSENSVVTFNGNVITVSKYLKDILEVELKVYIGNKETSSTPDGVLKFVFCPVEIETKITKSYIDESTGENYQIINAQNSQTIKLNDYFVLKAKNQSYNFTSNLTYDFIELGGAFSPIISENKITLVSLFNSQKTEITLGKRVENGSTITTMTLSSNFWNVGIDYVMIRMNVNIGSISQELRFYLAPYAVQYNYAYPISNGNSKIYHSAYIDYVYSGSATKTNQIKLSDIMLGDTSKFEYKFSENEDYPNIIGNNVLFALDENKVEVVNKGQLISSIYDNPNMSLIKDDFRRYAYLYYKTGVGYYLEFNMTTENGVALINNTLDFYICVTKTGDDTFVKYIHILILPYLEVKTEFEDVYERVVDETQIDYVYYQSSGEPYSLDFFYQRKINNVYNSSTTENINILNTKITNSALTNIHGVTYSVNTDDIEYYYLDENFIERRTTGTLESNYISCFAGGNNKLSIGSQLENVVYMKINVAYGEFTKDYFLKIIPKVKFVETTEFESPTNGSIFSQNNQILAEAIDFNESIAETIVTGEDYDLSNILVGYTPTTIAGKIDDSFLDENTNKYYTNYSPFSLDYKILFGWYYADGVPTAVTINENNEVIDIASNEVILSIDTGILLSSSNLTYEVFLYIEGSYEYDTGSVYSSKFYIRIIPALKFNQILIDNTKEEITSEGVEISIDPIEDTRREEKENKSYIYLSNYVEGRQITLFSNGSIRFDEKFMVSYQKEWDLDFEIKSIQLFTTTKSDNLVITDKTQIVSLLGENLVVFDEELNCFCVDMGYSVSFIINILVSTQIEDTIFSIPMTLTLFRGTVLEINYKTETENYGSIKYDILQSSVSEDARTITASKYMKSFVWETTSYKDVSDISAISLDMNNIVCRSNSPTGKVETSNVYYKVVDFTDAPVTITALSDVLGNFYFTFPIKLNVPNSTEPKDFNLYIKVLGKYDLVNAAWTENEETNIIIEDSQYQTTLKYINKDNKGLVDIIQRIDLNSEHDTTLGTLPKLTLDKLSIESCTYDDGTNLTYGNGDTSDYQLYFVNDTENSQIVLGHNSKYYDETGENPRNINVIVSLTYIYSVGSGNQKVDFVKSLQVEFVLQAYTV